MTQEFMWLTFTVILTMVLWIPYTLDRIKVRGLMGAMANPSRDDKPQSPWAQRLYFAHTNAVDNLVGTSKNSMPLGPVRVCCPDGMILGD